jgi:hypothetical protein
VLHGGGRRGRVGRLHAGMTDSRSYGHLSRHGVLRFMPLVLDMGELARVHGTSERLAVAAFAPAVCFTRTAIQRLAAGDEAARRPPAPDGAGSGNAKSEL